MMKYVDTWHVAVILADGFIWTCYGLPNETVAMKKADIFILYPDVVSIELVHTTREKPRARYKTEKFSRKLPKVQAE